MAEAKSPGLKSVSQSFSLSSFLSSPAISPLWKLFLSNNGLMTPQLQVLLDEQIAVTLLQTVELSPSQLGREVVLTGKDSATKILYAWSEWDKEALEELMQGDDRPIGAVIAAKGFESFREIESVSVGRDSRIEEALGENWELVQREYKIYKGQKELARFWETVGVNGPAQKILGNFWKE